jgi:hypothetical protein
MTTTELIIRVEKGPEGRRSLGNTGLFAGWAPEERNALWQLVIGQALPEGENVSPVTLEVDLGLNLPYATPNSTPKRRLLAKLKSL